VLVIGQYLDQLDQVAERLGAPVVTGKTPTAEREKLYTSFRSGETKLLIVSKVANFSIDLPEANVAIQISGTFGSRQEEAQRLGRILRPKADGGQAHFYTLVTRETKDQDFALHRQLFLAEQGYRYEILDATELVDEELLLAAAMVDEPSEQPPAFDPDEPAAPAAHSPAAPQGSNVVDLAAVRARKRGAM
jgi:DNA excision repair protein ERCC-3